MLSEELYPHLKHIVNACHRFKEAVSCEATREPNAMALATADSQGNPSVRMVLLKGYDQRGYIFYSNYDSAKAQQIKGGSTASLCFWWEPLERQVGLRAMPSHTSCRFSRW